MTSGPPDLACTASAELVASLRRQFGARVVETHVSWVLLDGRFAWKIKKPVKLPFLDFGDLATRARLCFEELRLNREGRGPEKGEDERGTKSGGHEILVQRSI